MTAAAVSQTLVLNRSYKPVAIADLERTFGLLVTGVAKALDSQFQVFDFLSWSALALEHGDSAVHTSTQAFKIPRVIVLQVFDRMPRSKIRFSRQAILQRDNFTCQYCNRQLPRTALNLDHVIPRTQGGVTCWENVVTSCYDDNTYKGGRTPAQAGMRLLREPVKPTWGGMGALALTGKIPYKEWLPFLDIPSAAYWNAELETE